MALSAASTRAPRFAPAVFLPQAQVVKCAERIIPSNGADVANKGGRTHLAITYPSPLGLSAATQKLVNSFSSREDLINAIASSIYIPLFAGPRLVTE